MAIEYLGTNSWRWARSHLPLENLVFSRHGKGKKAIHKDSDDPGQGIYQLGGLGLLLDATDSYGNVVSAIDLFNAPPEDDKPGDPCLAEFWGTDVAKHAAFIGEFLGLEYSATPLGAKLSDNGKPRIFFRNAPFDLPNPILVPYFLSTGVGSDCERARRAGAIVQVHKETIDEIGELVVLSDPSGAFFGLIDPSKQPSFE